MATKKDIEALAELKRKLDNDANITIPKYIAQSICMYCEYEGVYDKLGDYDNFYHFLKAKLNESNSM